MVQACSLYNTRILLAALASQFLCKTKEAKLQTPNTSWLINYIIVGSAVQPTKIDSCSNQQLNQFYSNHINTSIKTMVNSKYVFKFLCRSKFKLIFKQFVPLHYNTSYLKLYEKHNDHSGFILKQTLGPRHLFISRLLFPSFKFHLRTSNTEM